MHIYIYMYTYKFWGVASCLFLPSFSFHIFSQNGLTGFEVNEIISSLDIGVELPTRLPDKNLNLVLVETS